MSVNLKEYLVTLVKTEIMKTKEYQSLSTEKQVKVLTTIDEEADKLGKLSILNCVSVGRKLANKIKEKLEEPEENNKHE